MQTVVLTSHSLFVKRTHDVLEGIYMAAYDLASRAVGKLHDRE